MVFPTAELMDCLIVRPLMLYRITVCMLQAYINAREVFEDIRSQIDMRGFTDIQRAAMFYVQIKINYGADGRTYGCNKKNISPDYLAEVEKRLKTDAAEIFRCIKYKLAVCLIIAFKLCESLVRDVKCSPVLCKADVLSCEF